MSVIDRKHYFAPYGSKPDEFERYQQRMLQNANRMTTGRTTVLRETSNGSRIMSIELTPYGREALTVRVPLRPEVQRPRSRHRKSLAFAGMCALVAVLSFLVGVTAAELVLGAREVLLRSAPDASDLIVRWLQDGAR